MDFKQEIRENWFKNHTATYEEIDCRTRFLLWREPGTVCYKVKYLMFDNMLFITGDLGDAAFNLTWEATLESFTDISLHYFYSKLTAYNGPKKDFNSNEAIEELQEQKEILLEESGWSEEDLEVFDDLISEADGCTSVSNWEHVVNARYYDDLSRVDGGAWEWIFGVGDCIPSRVIAYWIGLKMAWEEILCENHE